MLVRRGLGSLGEAGTLRDGPGTPLVLSDKAIGTSAALRVSVIEEPVVSRLTVGGPIIGTFLNGPYQQETIHSKVEMLSSFTLTA